MKNARHSKTEMTSALDSLNTKPVDPKGQAFIYVCEILPGLIKIGWSRHVDARVRSLQSLIGVTDCRVKRYPVCSDRPRATEGKIHSVLREYRLGSGECFTCDFRAACGVVRRHLAEVCAE